MAYLTISGLAKRFGGAVALADVDLAVEEGAFIALLGPSGCGKTTLLRLIAGFERPDRGEIRLGGQLLASASFAIPPEERRIGMVFQSYALWPHMTVAGNVGFPLRVQKVPEAERARRVGEALRAVGLEALAGRRPSALSGGQRQRVALARCLVAEPRLVLLDEPLANLDPHLREAMLREFRRIHRERGATFIYVTHDQNEAMELADRVAVLSEGRLEQFAPPRSLYAEPATPMVAKFIGAGALVGADVVEGGGRPRVEVGGIVFPARGAAPAGDRVTLCLRPENIEPAAEGGMPVTVEDVVFRGDSTLASLRFASGEGAKMICRGAPPERGSSIRVRLVDPWILPQGAEARRAQDSA